MSNPAENRNIRGNTIKPAVVESDSVTTADAAIGSSISAESLSISNDPSNPTEYIGFSGTLTVSRYAVETAIVADNTANDLFKRPGEGSGSELRIFGQEGVNRFLDIVIVVAGSPKVVDSTTGQSPAGRSYSADGDMITLALNGGSETYNVITSAEVQR